MILIDKYLLAGCTLDISQYSEIISDTSKTCQNLEKKYETDIRGALILNAFSFFHTHVIVRGTRWRLIFIFSGKNNTIWRTQSIYRY